MKKQCKIISAFPGCGKSYCVANESDKFNGVLDSDSSEFSWVKDENGNNTNQRNPDFPENYIKHIKENLDKNEVIFVSSHKEVREALEKEGLNYILVYPNIFQKQDYIKRYKKRGNSQSFIDKVESNWEEWIGECEEEIFPIKITLPYFSVKYLNKEVIDLIEIMEG
jgi:hypothetical protein